VDRRGRIAYSGSIDPELVDTSNEAQVVAVIRSMFRAHVLEELFRCGIYTVK
jgi:hypothetical protein